MKSAAKRRSESPRTAAARCHSLAELEAHIPTCTACPRLITYCQQVAADKVRRYADWTYWGRPVPGFGDPAARILIVGLAPAAHGANRTGRLFTGDRSGDFLYAGLHRAGLASQAASIARGDGLTLRGVYISAAGRCAPPQNRPTPAEVLACRPYLQRELLLLTDLRVLIALGGLAHDTVLRALSADDEPPPRHKFVHGAVYPLGAAPLCDGRRPPLQLLDCYHVSQQNTFTGRLVPAMLDAVLAQARALAAL
jgi:uracil-DNA glycosylase family 4